MAKALQLDEELALDRRAIGMFAKGALTVAEDCAERLDVLGTGAGEESVNGIARGRTARHRDFLHGNRPARGGKHEQQGDSLHAGLHFGV